MATADGNLDAPATMAVTWPHHRRLHRSTAAPHRHWIASGLPGRRGRYASV
ncbi:hypothetical protein BZL30_7807 [Mycobacterium kansasii]|uniref:Uncharacterized protein n=1 Tax=Mycobacterium kansasii TaxID=1768 RepID=A0A1V3WKW5_MYCKA|nr:hypothetical protein BZL30_7807 [Mycobacterium kansasii]